MGNGRPRAPLVLAALIAAAMAAAGCQAALGPQASILDECANPTPANQDWCLSIRFPSTNEGM